MDYHNPLHGGVVPVSEYSTLAGALTQSNDVGLPPASEIVPRAAYNPTGRWNTDLATRTGISIPFNRREGVGMSLSEVFFRGPGPQLAEMMEGADDPVLSVSQKRIYFRISWPGYEKVEWRRSIELTSPDKIITRGSLAFQIADQYSRWIEYVKELPCDCPEWAVHRGDLKQFIILSVENVVNNNWQATIALVRDEH